MGSGKGEERTLNMARTVVTLEVSKLSGWLNDDAACRESKGEHAMWCEVQSHGRRELAGDRGVRSVQGRLDCRFGWARGTGARRSCGPWL